MGKLDAIAGHRVYLDANMFIYLLEGYAEYAEIIRELFSRIDQGQQEAVTSELSLAEVLVKPLIDGNRSLAHAYMRAIQSRGTFTVEPIRWSVLIEAARVRAEDGLKLPDAIHVATAALTGCTVFVTNDDRLRVSGNSSVVRLADLL